MKLTAKRRALIDEACNIIRENGGKYTSAFTCSTTVKKFVQLRIGTAEREHFLVMFLNSQNKLIADEILFSGTINSASVYPREVIKRALEHNAASIILAHNHPSGNSEPSTSDELLTQRIKQACGYMDIRVIDHVIAGEIPYSFAESGRINETS